VGDIEINFTAGKERPSLFPLDHAVFINGYAFKQGQNAYRFAA